MKGGKHKRLLRMGDIKGLTLGACKLREEDSERYQMTCRMCRYRGERP